MCEGLILTPRPLFSSTFSADEKLEYTAAGSYTFPFNALPHGTHHHVCHTSPPQSPRKTLDSM